MNTFYKCDICGKQFIKSALKANHIRWNHRDNDLYTKHQRTARLQHLDKTHGPIIQEYVQCSATSCTKNILIEYRQFKGKKLKYFCNRSCANSRGPRDLKFKREVGQRIKDLWRSGHYQHTTALNHLKNQRYFSSKREREIVKHFKVNFFQDGWKSGGRLVINTESISRDLYSDKLQICLEYDGIWHFEDIKQQLKFKQYKDKLLEQWCIKNQFRLIRIDENMHLSLQEIEDLVYNRHEMILKIGKRY